MCLHLKDIAYFHNKTYLTDQSISVAGCPLCSGLQHISQCGLQSQVGQACGSCEVMHPRWKAEPTWVCTEYSTVGNGETAMTYQWMCDQRQYSLYSLVGKLGIQ